MISLTPNANRSVLLKQSSVGRSISSRTSLQKVLAEQGIKFQTLKKAGPQSRMTVVVVPKMSISSLVGSNPGIHAVELSTDEEDGGDESSMIVPSAIDDSGG